MGWRMPIGAVLAAAAVVTGSSCLAYAEDAKQNDWAARLFAGRIGTGKAYACFVRRYDADHLARHPLQKVSVMKLLLTAEHVAEDQGLNYSFRLGVDFRNLPGDFDSSGECGHAQASETPSGAIEVACGVDCDGGGITVEAVKDGKSVMVKLESVRIWRANKPDEEAAHMLEGGADDRVFRLDRANLNDCASLVTDRKELAAMRRK